MSVDIVGENAKAGTYTKDQMHPGSAGGDMSVAGFARSKSVNVGDTVEFSITGSPAEIRIFRAGWYGGVNFLEVDVISNWNTEQDDGDVIPNSNGATTQTGWATTASWDVPADAVSGMYTAMIRNESDDDAFYADFVVRDDDAEVDIIIKTSEATWGAAYNYYGTPSAPMGKNLYGSGTGVGNIQDRSLAVSYHRPVITRLGVMQTYWWACELPMIEWIERNGFSVKYVTSEDLDKQGVDLLTKGKMFMSLGHDEYWSQNMWDAAVSYRDDHAGNLMFFGGNVLFWKVRFEYNGDETIMWCRKDSMPGPSGHSSGDPFVPGYGDWQGTWIDTRWPGRTPTELLTGTRFGMNGVYDYDMVIPQNPYAHLKVWGDTELIDQDLTFLQALGFEADHMAPTQPEESVRILAAYTRSAPGGLSDANGEYYNVPGNIVWGIVAQRAASGAATVGVGTCQWSWLLSNTHDRGSAVADINAKQFTMNVLRDLSGEPATPEAGLMMRAINSLDEYGWLPGSSGPAPEGDLMFNGEPYVAMMRVGGDLIRVSPLPSQ